MNGQNSATDIEELIQHAGWIRNLAYASLRDYALAEDVSQEVLLKALEGPRRSGRILRAWLVAVTRNMARNELRGKKRRRGREEKVARPEGDESDAEQMAILISHRAIADAVESLAPHCRQVIVLRFYECYSFKRIASKLAIEENAARVRLHRALHELRSALQAGHGDWRASCLALAPFAAIPAPSIHPLSAGKVLALTSAAGILGVALWWGGSWDHSTKESAPVAEVVGLETSTTWRDSGAELEIHRQDQLPVVETMVQPKEQSLASMPLNGQVFRTGFPVVGANVSAWQAGEMHTTETDSAGKFTFRIDPNEHANITVQANGEGRMAMWHVGSPREMIFDLWAAPVEGLDVHVYAGASRRGIPNATVQLYLDFSGADHGTSSQEESLQLVAEGVTNQQGIFQAPGWLADMYVVVSAQADGYLPNHAVPKGISTRYPEVHLFAGEQIPVQLIYADGTPVANAQLQEGLWIRRSLSTDSNGFLSPIQEWGKAAHTQAIRALPKNLSMVLPDGRIWSQGASTFSEDLVNVLADRLQLIVATDPVQVQLGDVVLPEGLWLEACCTSSRSLAWMAEDLDSMWQVVAQKERTTLEQGWVGGGVGVVRTRLMPSGTPFGQFPIVNGQATIEGQVGHLKLSLQTGGVAVSRDFEAVIQGKGAHKKTRIPFFDGVAEVDLRIELGDITLGTVEERYSGVKQNLQNAQGESVKGFFLLAEPWMEKQLVLMPNVLREVLIRVNGIAVPGGNADDIAIDSDGLCKIPFNSEGAPNLDNLELRMPARLQQQEGGLILSSLHFESDSELPGTVQQNSSGRWTWDFQLARVELQVPAPEIDGPRNVMVEKGLLRSNLRWPMKRPEGLLAYVTSPPQGGRCAFRVLAGTYAFRVGDFLFGGLEGVELPAGQLTVLQPDPQE